MNNKEEYIKCLKDPYYFINKYVRVYNKNTRKYCKPKLNKIQIEILKKLWKK